DGHAAIDAIDNSSPDLVILDLMLPGQDGLSVCREVRPRYHGAILMLTALDDDIDEVAGLETGADDYLAKPVRPRVLLARIRALLRRGEGKPTDTALQEISTSQLIINRSNRTVLVNQSAIDVTDAEFALLWLFAEHKGQVLSRDDINRNLRGLEHDGFDRSIDLRVSRLRKKIGDDPKEPQMIKSVRGKGYLLTP
ncbi:MAG: winged helix-turn-helix domain-containing protein, partial [Pseudomonadota bacterium]